MGTIFTEYGQAVATDTAGNVYATGWVNGAIDFDPGPGTSILTPASINADVYVAKYTPAGSLVWARSMGTTGNLDSGVAITVDAAGNVYTTGPFDGNGGDFDPGTGTAPLNNAGSTDIFVSKLDSSGNFVWARSLGGTGSDGAGDIAVDSSGNVIVVGSFTGTADFDPGSGTFNLTSAGDADVFVSKLDSSGNFVWARALGGSDVNLASSVALDATGNVWVTGRFRGTADFDPGTGTFDVTSAGSNDVFVAKLNAAGNFVWAGGIGGATSGDTAGAIAVDSAGNVVLTGAFQGTADFDPSSATSNLNAAGNSIDIFVCKLDSSGRLIWARDMGGSSATGNDTGYGIALDAADNIYTTGHFYSSGDFDPGPNVYTLTSAGTFDIFVSKLDSAGNFVWAGSMGGTDQDTAFGIAVGPSGDIFTTGISFATADFDPGPGTYNLTAVGAQDIFISKLVQSGVLITQSGGSTNVAEGGATDSYTVVLTNAPSADVTIRLDAGSQLTASPTSLVFTTSNWSTPQTVTVAAVADSAVEGAHSGTITHTITTSDSTYQGVTVASVNVSITDSVVSESPVTVTPSGGSTDVAEGSGTDTYTVVLNTRPTGNVTITISAPGQVSVAPPSLVFSTTNWNVPRVVTVTAIDDTTVEGDQTVTITHVASSSDPNYAGVNIPGLPVNVADNDNPQVKFTSADGVVALLEGASRSYSAALNSAPTADVTVTFAPESALSLSVNELVFTPANWNIAQIVTMTAPDNSGVDGNRMASIVYSTSSADTFFDDLGVPETDVMVVDDENTLVVNGTGGGDSLSVLFSPSLIQVVLNGRSTFSPTTYSQVLVLAGGGNDVIKLSNPSIPVAVLAAGGTDTVQIDGSASANSFDVDATAITINGRIVTLGDTEKVILNGKGAEDTFTVNDVPTFAVSLQGFGGADRVIGPDNDTLWKITGISAGTLAGTITFGAVENLTGGAGDDRFVFLAGKSIGGQVDGGAGNNILDYSAYKSVVTANLQTGVITGARGFANIASLIGGSALDKLVGANTANVWNISGANSGDVGGVAFTGFENLTGGSDDDAFIFADAGSLRGKIDGGVGADTLDYTAVAANLTVNLQTKIATRTGGWLGLENFVGGQGTNALIGRNAASTWTLSSIDAGTVTGGFSFAGFQNLTGGTLADLFDLTAGGEWSGLLDGGAGLDSLTSSAGGVYVSTGLNAGTLNGRAFRNVERRQ